MEVIRQIFHVIIAWIQDTGIPTQLEEVDAIGLFTNPWFIIPFICMIGYLIYKQSFKDILIFSILFGIWYASGTDYMQTLIVDGQLQLNKVLPIMGAGAAALAFIIYLIFGRNG